MLPIFPDIMSVLLLYSSLMTEGVGGVKSVLTMTGMYMTHQTHSRRWKASEDPLGLRSRIPGKPHCDVNLLSYVHAVVDWALPKKQL